MTNQIEIGETLEMINAKGEVWGRLVHLGDGICNSERFIPHLNASGHLNCVDPNGKWEISKANVPLTAALTAEWLKRKGK